MKVLETDVAIVAAGPAGLCAAVAAAEGGAEVMVFEKMSTFGGTANMGMGPFGVESRIQKRQMINLKKEECFRRFMDYVHWQADAKLVHDYFWKSGSTIDWLEDMGVQFVGAMKNFPESEPTWHVVMPEGGGKPGARCASAMNKTIYERAQELGVQFYFETPVKDLIVDKGEVIGLKAEGPEESYEVYAGAVIVATGGFGTNPEMIHEQTGYTLNDDIHTFQVPGIMGEGIQMAWRAGAGHGRMEMERIIFKLLPGSMLGERPEMQAFHQGGILAVNKSGYRVCDESVMQNTSVAANIIDYQQGKTLYCILDDNTLDYYLKHDQDFPSEVFPCDPFTTFRDKWPEYSEQFPEVAFTADSVEELAEKMGIPAENLKETVAQYNQFCDQNYDDDFGKDRNFMHALRGPRYYATRIGIGAYGSLGGIKTDYKLRAITDDYQVIPGLFGAGTDVCSLYNGTYYFYFPGSTMGFAVNSGRMAGEYAARYALGEDI